VLCTIPRRGLCISPRLPDWGHTPLFLSKRYINLAATHIKGRHLPFRFSEDTYLCVSHATSRGVECARWHQTLGGFPDTLVAWCFYNSFTSLRCVHDRSQGMTQTVCTYTEIRALRRGLDAFNNSDPGGCTTNSRVLIREKKLFRSAAVARTKKGTATIDFLIARHLSSGPTGSYKHLSSLHSSSALYLRVPYYLHEYPFS